VSICRIEECDARVYSLGLCNKHRLRLQRTGTTDLVPYVPYAGRPCTIGLCRKKVHARGMCATHHSRWYLYGDPFRTRQTGAAHVNWQGEDIGYAGAHQRVYRLHGSASDWQCAMQCGQQAYEWAYCHDAANELVESRDGYDCSYSADPWDYVPLCASCHRSFDRRMANA
jgi:hypothetical protein